FLPDCWFDHSPPGPYRPMTRDCCAALPRRLVLSALPLALALLTLGWYPVAPRAAERTAPATAPGSFDQVIRPFLAKHCLSCHGEQKQSGSLALHQANANSVQDDRTTWESVLEKLRGGEMPPKKKPQPSADEKKAVLAWIEAELAKTACTGPIDPGRVTLRRL